MIKTCESPLDLAFVRKFSTPHSGDGKVEIIAVGFSATGKDVIALSHDGKSVLWRTAIDPSCGNFCTVADVDGNGKPEIVAGRSVLDHTGKLKSTLSELSHFISTLVDLVGFKY